jgi:flagellar assembly protein FliH
MAETSNYWTAESLGTAVQRWDLPDFSPPPVPAMPVHTAEHFDELERTAYEDGYARGHAEGSTQGYGDGAARVREQVAALKNVFDHCGKPLKALDAEVERALIALALEVGRRLAQATLVQSPEAIAGVIREALGALATPTRDARIHLHPADVELVQETLTLSDDYTGWRLVADRTLMRGDCLVITDSARVDARLDTREAAVAKAVLGEQT